MISTVSNTRPTPSEPAWLKRLVPYRTPSRPRSLFELGVTILPLALLWALCWIALAHGYWWGLVLTVPAAGFLVRLFMIQHDCGHGAFFGQRQIDDWIGRALGVLTLTPYDCWRRTHAIHHASSGNLDARGIGDVMTLTVAEYRALSAWGRRRYRFYRHPAVMFGIGPTWLFVVQQRLPFGMMRAGVTPWISAMATNLAIAGLAIGLIWLVGWLPFLLIQLPIILIAGTAGVWLFYVQHQFEDTRWTGRQDWDIEQAALHGSSYYDLPAVLRWFTANIGIHHVHHISSRVPYYRLPEVLRDYPELKQFGRITLLDSFRGVKLALWDEATRRLVSFDEARALS
ncbi:MAG: fatty acid desaturase [Devosia sp.]|nr:fatty acid desaturase [Devosia sp.]